MVVVDEKREQNPQRPYIRHLQLLQQCVVRAVLILGAIQGCTVHQYNTVLVPTFAFLAGLEKNLGFFGKSF